MGGARAFSKRLAHLVQAVFIHFPNPAGVLSRECGAVFVLFEGTEPGVGSFEGK
jgi:hypothetical protein